MDTLILQRTVFTKELISNGKLQALRKSDLKFRVEGELQEIKVKNGQWVKMYQPIAVLDQFEYRQKLAQAQTALNTSELELADILLGRKYSIETIDEVPEDILSMARIRSGHIDATRDVETAQYELEASTLRAPFTGMIANLKSRTYEQIDQGEAFCTLIDNLEFEVEFYLIESEVADINLNNSLTILPYSLPDSFKGHVSEINPVVDENGLVMVKARVRNTGVLMEGMNVKVLTEKKITEQLVVPKSAIVLRQNQEVLFKYNDGRAFWTYVQTGLENSTSYTVWAHPDKGGSLEPGDTVIVSGNLNLAHESDVIIQ
ncbi:MAG: efflux RND transporter periplasmic adaptor subunit [Bacteroidota bacterium]